MAIVAGTRFDRYEIIAPLGRGGMGEVYTARDTQLGRQVALKFLPELFTADRARLARFAQEARAASALNHPNIITVYEVGQVDGTHYIATEFVVGETLRQRLVRAPLAIEEALEIAAQTCAALAAAHEAGIVHRDIKPENVMLRRDGYVKVLDFGLAKLTDPADAADTEAQTRQMIYTAPGTVVGTVDYMSPEQARGLEVDERTDIWAVGVVLYEMVAGRRPFTGETKTDVLAAILKTEPEPLASQHEPVPDELRRIVDKTLRVRREERYQTVKDLLVDLKSLKRALEFSAHALRATGPAVSRAAQTVEVPPAAATTPSSILAAPRFSLRHALLLVPLAVVVLGATWWFGARRSRQVGALALKTTEVVSWQSAPGEGYSTGAFSPDARMVAFVSTKSGSRNIWVKQTNAGEPVQVTRDEFKNDAPVWSPTGDEIAFFSLRGEQYGIWRVPALGGTPTLVKTLAAGEGDAKPRAWSKQGLLYYESKQNLFALDLQTAQTVQLTDFGAGQPTASSFSVSPDGERIAYIGTDADGRNNVWYAAARGSAGGGRVQLTDDSYEHRNTVWTPDGRRVLYSAQVDGTFQIFAVALDHEPPVQLTNGERDSFVLAVSADGTRVLYGAAQEESDVWGVRVADGAEFAVATDITAELWPAASADGQTVVYQAVKNLSQGDKLFHGALLAKRATTDEPPAQLAPEGFLPQWSPDGRQVAFMRSTERGKSLWTVRATGGDAKQLVSDLPVIENTLLPYNRTQAASFAWSPDGRQIAYCSDRTGQTNVWVVAADGTGDAQVTANGDANEQLACPLWSADGRYIAYWSKPYKAAADGRLTYRVWVVEPATKATKLVTEADTFQRLLGWAQTGRALLLATSKGKTGPSAPTDVELVEVSVETGAQRRVAGLQAVHLYNIHLSPDRKSVAFVAHRDDKDNIWLLPLAGGAARKLTVNNDPRLYFSSLAWSPDGRAIYFGKQTRHSLLAMITNFQ